MLQSIRDRTQGWITSTIIGLLVIIFALWGIHGYLELNTKKENKVIARVAGQSLSQSDFDRIYQRFYQQAERLDAGGFAKNKKLTKQLKQQALEQWKQIQVLTQAALQAKYRISQSLIDSVLLNIPAFQSAGRFSAQNFYNVLKALDYTKFQFLVDLKKTLLINQVQQGIIQSAFVLPEEINQSIKLRNQKRDFAYLIVPYSRFLSKQLPSADSQALVYYQQNKQDFLQAEQVSIEYIELSLTKERNDKIFVKAKDKLANLSYTYPDSLEVAAKTLSLPINSTSYFSRKGGRESLTKDPKIIAAAFSQDVLQGNNSPVITIHKNSTAIVLRIKQHKPSIIQPYSAVREKIMDILNKQMAIAKARVLGEDLLKELVKGSPKTNNFARYNLSWRFIKQAGRKRDLEWPILNAAFKLTPPNKSTLAFSSLAGFSLPNGDYALVKLISVHEGNDKPIKAQQQKLYREELAKNFGQLDYALYVHGLLEKAKLVQH